MEATKQETKPATLGPEELTMGQNQYLNELRLLNLFEGLRHYLSDHHLMYNRDHQLSEEEAKPVRDLIIGLIESREVMCSSLVEFDEKHPKPRSNNGPSNAEIYDGYITALLKNVAELSENKTLKTGEFSTKSYFIPAQYFDQNLAKFNKQKEFVKSNKFPELLAQAYNECGAENGKMWAAYISHGEFGKSTRIIPKINLQQVLERCKDLNFIKYLDIVNENLLNDPKAQQDWNEIFTKNLKNLGEHVSAQIDEQKPQEVHYANIHVQPQEVHYANIHVQPQEILPKAPRVPIFNTYAIQSYLMINSVSQQKHQEPHTPGK